MKNLACITVLCMLLTSCMPIVHDKAKEKMLLGRWVTTGETYNREWFAFKKDGSFIDERFPEMSAIKSRPKALTFAISQDRLFLKYLSPFNLPAIAHYQILNLNDSLLVLASRATNRYPSKVYHLKKMKLHGKFISK